VCKKVCTAASLDNNSVLFQKGRRGRFRMRIDLEAMIEPMQKNDSNFLLYENQSIMNTKSLQD
jgi:hypothetical protein